jgi:hypothetical protein
VPDHFERRDSLRRYAPISLRPPDGGDALETKGVVSLRGIFLEGANAVPSTWQGALVQVEAQLGGAKPLKAVCLVAVPERSSGFLLTWQTLDFENERELARYLDEPNTT